MKKQSHQPDHSPRRPQKAQQHAPVTRLPATARSLSCQGVPAQQTTSDPPRHNWIYRRVALPILALLRLGASPERLAWSLAIGLVVGINPILGSTTFLCLLLAFLLRLNIAASQLTQPPRLSVADPSARPLFATGRTPVQHLFPAPLTIAAAAPCAHPPDRTHPAALALGKSRARRLVRSRCSGRTPPRRRTHTPASPAAAPRGTPPVSAHPGASVRDPLRSGRSLTERQRLFASFSTGSEILRRPPKRSEESLYCSCLSLPPSSSDGSHKASL